MSTKRRFFTYIRFVLSRSHPWMQGGRNHKQIHSLVDFKSPVITYKYPCTYMGRVTLDHSDYHLLLRSRSPSESEFASRKAR